MHIQLLELENTPIYKQLQLEEALLRSTDQNYCIINKGSPPSIVMGISAKIDDVLCRNSLKNKDIPIIKRFSGGGTVIVDTDTIFVSFIFHKSLLNIPLYPEPIMRWSGDFYKKALELEEFNLRENDYVIGNKKCGGNAQYIQKDRFVHHTTFLWDFVKENMNHLKYPKKVPSYRNKRNHHDFLCTLKSHFSKDDFITQIKAKLQNEFTVSNINLETVSQSLLNPHRKATQTLSL